MSRNINKRPSSDEIIDLHICVVPTERWNQCLNCAGQDVIEEAFSAGFIRIHPSRSIHSLRNDISEQMEDYFFSANYVFLKHVGRCLALVREKQEHELKAKHFIFPGNVLPELFILPFEPSTYKNLILPSMGKKLVKNVKSPSNENFPPVLQSKDSLSMTTLNAKNKFILQDDTQQRNGNDAARKLEKVRCKPQNTASLNTNASLIRGETETENKKSHSRLPRNADGDHLREDHEKKRLRKTHRSRQDLQVEIKNYEGLKPQLSRLPLHESTARLKEVTKTNYNDKKLSLPSCGTVGMEPLPYAEGSLRPKSRGSELLFTDSDFLNNNNGDKTLQLDTDVRLRDNFITANKHAQHPQNDDTSLPPLPVDGDESPISIPKFAKSLVPSDFIISANSGPQDVTEENRRASISSSSEAAEQDQMLWQELQRVQEDRKATGKPQQHVARKTKTEIEKPQPVKKIVKFDSSATMLNENSADQVVKKCTLCPYICATETDRQRHYSLIHSGKSRRKSISTGESQIWLSKVISATSEERLQSSFQKHRGRKKSITNGNRKF